jgi:hypothetical protein
MIAHRLGFHGNGYKPALAQTPQPIVLPKAPEAVEANSNGQVSNMLFLIGLTAIAVIFTVTVAMSDGRD